MELENVTDHLWLFQRMYFSKNPVLGMPLSYRSVFLRNSVKALKMYKSNSCLAEQRAESALNQHAQL